MTYKQCADGRSSAVATMPTLCQSNLLERNSITMDPCFLVVVVDCNDNKNFLLEVNPSKNLRIPRKEEQDEEQEQETLPQTLLLLQIF